MHSSFHIVFQSQDLIVFIVRSLLTFWKVNCQIKSCKDYFKIVHVLRLQAPILWFLIICFAHWLFLCSFLLFLCLFKNFGFVGVMCLPVFIYYVRLKLKFRFIVHLYNIWYLGVISQYSYNVYGVYNCNGIFFCNKKFKVNSANCRPDIFYLCEVQIYLRL